MSDELSALGFRIVSHEDIRPGDVLMISEPVVAVNGGMITTAEHIRDLTHRNRILICRPDSQGDGDD